MKNTILFWKNIISFQEKRLSYLGEPSADKLEVPSGQPAPAVEVQGPQEGKKVDYKENLEATLLDLANQNDTLKANYRKSIEEGLRIYTEGVVFNDFNRNLETQNSKNKVQVKIENRHIVFFHMENGKEVLDGPKPNTVPIRFKILPIVNPEAKAEAYYDPNTGKVDFKGSEIKKTVGDIFLNVRKGTQITVKAPGQKERSATFQEQDGGNNKWIAYYDDATTERVKIYSGYIVKLKESKPRTPEESPEKNEYQLYPQIASVKVGDNETYKELDTLIDAALKGDEQIGGNQDNLQRIKKLADAKAIDKQSYTDFLYKKGAIKMDGTVNLIVWTEKETEVRDQEQGQKQVQERQERERRTARDQEWADSTLMAPGHINWFLRKGTKFELKDPAIIEAVANPAKWNQLWDHPEAAPAIKELKTIISSPQFKNIFIHPLNTYRDRIREAIYTGEKEQYDLEDFINKIIGPEAIMSPGKEWFLSNATPEMAEKNPNVVANARKKPALRDLSLSQIVSWEGLQHYEPSDFDTILGICKNFAANLGAGVDVRVNTAGVVPGTFTNDYYIGLAVIKDNAVYWVSLTRTTGSGSTTIKIQKPGQAEKVIEMKTNKVTGEVTDEKDFREYYAKYMNADGSAKPGTPPEIATQLRTTVLAGLRFASVLGQRGGLSTTRLERAQREEVRGTTERGALFQNRTINLADQVDSSRYDAEIKPLVEAINDESGQKWAELWGPPSRILGLRQLQETIAKNPVFAKLKDTPDLKERVRKAFYNGNSKQLDIEDILNVLIADAGINMPSPFAEAKEAPRGSRFKDYFESQTNPPEVLKSAKGLLLSLGVYDNATIDLSKEIDEKDVRLTFNYQRKNAPAGMYQYTVRLGRWPATHKLFILNANGTEMSEDFIADNSEQYKASTLASGQEMRDYFEKQTTPKALPQLNFNNFRDFAAKHFDKRGNRLPGTPQNYIDFYNNVMSGATSILDAAKNLRYSPGLAETEAQAGGSGTNMLRNAKMENGTAGDLNVGMLYNIEELIALRGSNEILGIQTKHLNQLGNTAGIYLSDNILETSGYNGKVGVNRPVVLKYLFQLYDLQSLISQGCFKQVQLEGGKEEYVLYKVPAAFKNWLLQPAQSGKPGEVNLDWLIANPTAALSSSAAETINRRLQGNRYINSMFPPIDSQYSMADLESAHRGTMTISAAEKDLVSNRMSQKYANEQFMAEVMTEGQLDMAKFYKTVNFLLQRGFAGLMENHPPDGDQIKNRILTKYPEWNKNAEKVGTQSFYDFTSTGKEAITDKNVEQMMKDTDIITLIREGFVLAHSEAIYHRQEKTEQRFQEALKSPQAQQLRAKIEEMVKERAKQEPKIPDSEIQSIVEETFPIAFSIGWGSTTGTFGVGAETGVNLPLSKKHPEYGNFVLGGGVAVGYAGREESLGVGAGAAAGYQTGEVAGFKLAIVAGGGLGVTSEGVSAGPSVGVGLGIPEIKVGTTKIESTIGVFYHPMLGIVPGIVLSFDKDHKLTIENMTEAAHQAYGVDKVELATSPEAKVKAIKENTQLYSIIRVNLRAEGGREWKNPSDADILRHYEVWKRNMDNEIRVNYNPGTFSGFSVGFGVDANTGKFIFGIGTKINVRQDKVRAASTPQERESDIERQQLLDIINKPESERTEQDRRRIEISYRGGVIEMSRDGKMPGMAEVIDHSSEVPETPDKVSGTIRSIQDLETRLNIKYKPLGLRVEYSKEKGLFELLIPPQNNTNIDIAVDTNMAGGILIDNGRLYLGSAFNNPDKPFTVKRSDYHFPLPEEGANYKSIISISDNRDLPAHEIYRNAPQTLSLRNGIWEIIRGQGAAKAEANPNIKSNIYFNQPMMINGVQVKPSPLDAQIKVIEPAPGTVQEDPAKADYEAFTMSTAERLEGRDLEAVRAKITAFAEKLTKDPIKGVTYRKLSNNETTTRDFKPLNEFILSEWETAGNDQAPSPAELMLIRGELAHASFNELENSPEVRALGRNPDKNSATYKEAMRIAYERRIEALREIVTKEFDRLIKQNHDKYKEGDPQYIVRSSDELSRYAINRVKSAYDKDNPEKDAVLLRNIQSTSTLAATLGILGFRGNLNSSDAQPDRMMILSERYEQLLNNPADIRSDLGKVIIESASPIDKLDTTTFKFENVKQFIENNLTLKILNKLATPESAKLFKQTGNITPDQMRTAILKLAASRNATPTPAVDDAAKAALTQLGEITDAVRRAEITGQKEYRLPHDPNVVIKITQFEVADGVYKKCTNYSMWLNENLELGVATETGPVLCAGNAAYGLAKLKLIPETGVRVTNVNVGAAVDVKPKASPPPPPGGPGGGNAGGGGSSSADTKSSDGVKNAGGSNASE